jgi:hypothetical protein
MNEMVKRLMLVELRKQGYHRARYDAEKDAVLPSPASGIEMREHEIWWPRGKDTPYVLGELWQSDKDREEKSRRLVYHTFLPILNKATEMAAAWENAKPMPIRDVSEFRLLSEYNNIVLAARDDGEHGLHFTTWQYTYDRKGVGQGHYTTDYEGAKKDFATRSGLIQEKVFFQPEQLKQIYTALLFQGKNDDELTYDTEKKLHAVIEKLENICPDLKELKVRQEQQSEQEYEAEPELE